MQVETAIDGVERSLETQLTLGAADRAVEEAGRLLLGVIRPVLREWGTSLLNQAATEVGSQLPGYRVELVLTEGEPAIRVTPEEGEGTGDEDLAARITLRLPSSVKQLVEEAAAQRGESVNTWVVKTLGGRARAKTRPGRSFSESFDL